MYITVMHSSESLHPHSCYLTPKTGFNAVHFVKVFVRFNFILSCVAGGALSCITITRKTRIKQRKERELVI